MLEVSTKDSLNDMLIQLPYVGGEPFDFTFQGKCFRAFPENAYQFTVEYSSDNYSQCAVRGAKSLEALLEFIYTTGDIVEEIS